MTTVTLRPNGTVDPAPSIVQGSAPGATTHQVTADDSDGSYAILLGVAGGDAEVAVGTTSLGSGVTKHVRIRVRARAATANVTWLSAGVRIGTDTWVAWMGNIPLTQSYAVKTSAYSPVTLTQADIDALQARFIAPLADGSIDAAEVYVDLVIVPQPSVALDAIASTYTAGTRLETTWQNTLDADGGGQTHRRMWVTDDNDNDAILWDSAVVATSVTAADTGTLPNGATVTVHVQVAQTVNGTLHWSAEDTQTGILIDVDTADVASVTFAPNNATARNVVTVTWDNTSETWDYIEVERLDPGGIWAAVRGATLVPIGPVSTFQIDDDDAPNTASVKYRARATWFDDGLQVGQPLPRTAAIVGDWVESAAGGSWASPSVWVKVPGQPALNMTVCLESLPTLRHRRRRTSHPVAGRPDPVVISDVRSLAFGEIAVQVATDSDAVAFDAVLDASATVLIQGPPGWYGWGSRYCSIAEDEVRWVRPGRRFTDRLKRRSFMLVYEQIARPPDPTAGSL